MKSSKLLTIINIINYSLLTSTQNTPTPKKLYKKNVFSSETVHVYFISEDVCSVSSHKIFSSIKVFNLHLQLSHITLAIIH